MSSNIVTERIFAETIAAQGGRAYRVGACVHDMIRGINPNGIDFCVVGMVKKNFKGLFPDAVECGKYFPVFRLSIAGVKCEIAFARTERKDGSGHRGFKIASNPKITIEQDLFRRDTTVNAMAIDCLTGEVIDPFHGMQDSKDGMLRATGRHFSDDPMRALRLAGEAARLDYEIDGATLNFARAAGAEIGGEPSERLFAEMAKALREAPAPAKFFKILAKVDLLPLVFKEIADLSAENFRLAMAELDAVAKAASSAKLRFAVLGSVLDEQSLLRWNNKMTLPVDWFNAANISRNVMRLLAQPDPGKIVGAIQLLRRGALSVEEFDIISQAVERKLPALGPYQAIMTSLSKDMAPEQLKGKEIGEWLRRKYVEVITKAWAKEV